MLDGRGDPRHGHGASARSGSCHDRPWGALAIVDRRLGIDGRGRVVRTWPADADRPGRPGRLRHVLSGAAQVRRPIPALRQVLPLLADDRPRRADGDLPARHVRQRDSAPRRRPGLLRPDAAGAAPAPAGHPLADRPRRRAKATSTWPTSIAGTRMEGSARARSSGCAWWNRRRSGTGPPGLGRRHGHAAPGMDWHDFNNKRILGTVPVEADGTAYFAVPADTFVYFQLLDDSGMMIQSMRSGTIVQPGETGRLRRLPRRPPQRHARRAARRSLRRGPSRLEPWHGPPRMFSYTAEVQPVFDKHCVAVPRLRQDGGQEAQPGRRPGADLQRFLRRAAEQAFGERARGRPHPDAAAVLLGQPHQQAGGHDAQVPARQDGQPRGLPPRRDVDRTSTPRITLPTPAPTWTTSTGEARWTTSSSPA